MPGSVAGRRQPLAESALLPYFSSTLAKLTSKNQLTLPRRALDALGASEPPTHFKVEVDEGRIILTPARIGSADAVRRKLSEPGITDQDVADAVAWARRR